MLEILLLLFHVMLASVFSIAIGILLLLLMVTIFKF